MVEPLFLGVVWFLSWGFSASSEKRREEKRRSVMGAEERWWVGFMSRKGRKSEVSESPADEGCE